MLKVENKLQVCSTNISVFGMYFMSVVVLERKNAIHGYTHICTAVNLGTQGGKEAITTTTVQSTQVHQQDSSGSNARQQGSCRCCCYCCCMEYTRKFPLIWPAGLGNIWRGSGLRIDGSDLALTWVQRDNPAAGGGSKAAAGGSSDDEDSEGTHQ